MNVSKSLVTGCPSSFSTKRHHVVEQGNLPVVHHISCVHLKLGVALNNEQLPLLLLAELVHCCAEALDNLVGGDFHDGRAVDELVKHMVERAHVIL